MFDCGDGIYGIDTFYEREGCTSVYIICSGGRCGIIESAANSSLPHLLSALEELNVGYADVDFLALTHVHLDHAGGAGSYMQKFPNAKLIVHPRGAKHMADPTALIEGVCEVYGKSETERMYGEIIPVDKERIISAGDGYVFHIGEKKNITLETPGHAKHHNSYYDESDSVIFSGDAFGVSYSEMQTEKGRWAIPTTSPVQFSPEDMVSSINRMLALNPKKILLTHFGNHVVRNDRLCQWLLEVRQLSGQREDLLILGQHVRSRCGYLAFEFGGLGGHFVQLLLGDHLLWLGGFQHFDLRFQRCDRGVLFGYHRGNGIIYRNLQFSAIANH